MRGVVVVCMACVASASASAQPAPVPSPPTPRDHRDSPEPPPPPPAPRDHRDEPPPPIVPQPTTSDTPAPANPPVAVEAGADVSAGVHNGTVTLPAILVHIEYGLDFGIGPTRGAQPTQGYAVVFGLPVNVFLLPWLGVGVRGQVVYSQDPAADGPMTPYRSDDVETDPLAAWSATAGPRFRFWSDPAARLRWVVDVDAGYVHPDPISPAGPLARLSLGRQVGIFNPQGNGANLGVSLAAETGLGPAASYRAFYASAWFHGESGVFAATDPGDDGAWFPSTFSIDMPMLLGKNFGDVPGNLIFGVAAAFGVAVSDLLEPRIRIDTHYIRHSDQDATKTLGASAGTRLRFDHYGAPAFVDLYAGYEHAYGVEPRLIGNGRFVDVGTGLHIVACKFEYDLGVRFRLGVSDDNSKLADIALVLGGARGNTVTALGKPIGKCD
ncbi:MAG TPA: hypothetical protein VFV99_08725 [Kofleriaceae bacterium]|nr:hypothetical protein [Kofleriaceae bacterium]